MGDRVFISWNIANWITVVLMVALGYLVVSLIYNMVTGKQFSFPPGPGAAAA